MENHVAPDCPRSRAKTCGFIDIRMFLNDAHADWWGRSNSREGEGAARDTVSWINHSMWRLSLPFDVDARIYTGHFATPIIVAVTNVYARVLHPMSLAGRGLRICFSLRIFEFASSRAANRSRDFHASRVSNLRKSTPLDSSALFRAALN